MKPRPCAVPGFVNRNKQVNLGRTNPPRPGSDHVQVIYVMRCLKCGQNYGANGTDIWQRKCPFHAGGMHGLALTPSEEKWTTPHG